MSSGAPPPPACPNGGGGLDFHYDNAPRDRQRDAFAAQADLARAAWR